MKAWADAARVLPSERARIGRAASSRSTPELAGGQLGLTSPELARVDVPVGLSGPLEQPAPAHSAMRDRNHAMADAQNHVNGCVQRGTGSDQTGSWPNHRLRLVAANCRLSSAPSSDGGENTAVGAGPDRKLTLTLAIVSSPISM